MSLHDKVIIDREDLDSLIQMAANDDPHNASYAAYQADLLERANTAMTNTTAIVESLQEMVDMMTRGEEHGAGSPWYLKAVEALRNV